ncbi:hypothetical protein PN36_14540 [Candidatus Thiomargarita nelsonii]|uniref:Uncharacterized protein n=1 Tax=Candidatus Thiomargarita nelsonii TaxID=1003181 RepID=A0A4E0QTD6_9GAMM|nr:hypothetical protein PN36_28875 [Candidatus Thiomargarita nelsonii]TGO03000.1 hypothetical protein PN36_14540 [Candidatus Thiomargarita nelsonii]
MRLWFFSYHGFSKAALVLCQFVFLGLEYKALALSDSTTLPLCTPKKQIDRVLDLMSEHGILWSTQEDLDGLLDYVKLRRLPELS